jgi:uncharacterized repeat protein (TIGR02543 family)
MKTTKLIAFVVLASMLFAVSMLVLAPAVYAEFSSQGNVVQAKFSYMGGTQFADAQTITFTSANGKGLVSFQVCYWSTTKELGVMFNVTGETTVDMNDIVRIFVDFGPQFSENQRLRYFFVYRDPNHNIMGSAGFDYKTNQWVINNTYSLWPSFSAYKLSLSDRWLVLMVIGDLELKDNQTLGIAVTQFDESIGNPATYWPPEDWANLTVSKRSASISTVSSASAFRLNDEVMLTSNITPTTSNGTVTFQYSKDGGDWTRLASGKLSNGTYSSKWIPSIVASKYQVRTVWSGDEVYRNATSTIVFNHLNVSSAYGTLTGTPIGWYLNGSKAEFSITPTLVDHGNGTRRIFTGWSGDSSTSTKIDLIMDKPYSLTANWKTQYYVKIDAGAGVVNTTSQWLDLGASLTVEAISPSKVVEDKSRVVFTGWSGSITSIEPKATVTVDTNKTLVANWKNQYYLKVSSEYGEPKGESWYDEGATASFSVTSPVGLLIQQVFDKWSGDSTATTTTASFTMNSPKTVTAIWTTDYTQLIALVAGIVVVIGGIIFALRRRKKK